jgi:hypothetical protein
MARFNKIKKNKTYLDCLKFFQSTLSSGQNLGLMKSIDESDPAQTLQYSERKPSNSEIGGVDSCQVVEKNECLSLDYIVKMQNSSKTNFKWDPDFCSGAIKLSADCRHAFLSEDTYIFRTVIADVGFTEGTHYWEIVADAKTENELKIGVIKGRDIDFNNTAFSDYSCGWAYYGTG